MNKSILLLFLLVLCFCCACSKSASDDPQPEDESPILISTVPQSGITIAPDTEKAVFTFNQNIQLVNQAKITLNGEQIQQTGSIASALGKELIIRFSNLEESMEYTLSIEPNCIMGIAGSLNTESYSLKFKTNEYPKQEIKVTLVTKNPLASAKKVYDFLRENYGKKIISGTMANVAWNTNEAEWVYKHTGKYPALAGFDYIFLHYSPANWINYEDTKVAEDWWTANGLITASWHWNVPNAEGTTNYDDYNFYTKDTSFDIREALKDGTWQNKVIVSDLDKIADNLLLLQKKNIPLLWRPLHEASGGWFWWGAKGAEAYKALWKLMFETFQAKGLNNLIWVWTAEGDATWYPGDDYVDIIGRDIYNKTATSQLLSEYTDLKNRYSDKMITLSECGNVAQISAQWNAKTTWSWFMPWYDYERTNDLNSAAFNQTTHEHADVAWWKDTMKQEFVISRDMLPGLYQ